MIHMYGFLDFITTILIYCNVDLFLIYRQSCYSECILWLKLLFSSQLFSAVASSPTVLLL